MKSHLLKTAVLLITAYSCSNQKMDKTISGSYIIEMDCTDPSPQKISFDSVAMYISKFYSTEIGKRYENENKLNIINYFPYNQAEGLWKNITPIMGIFFYPCIDKDIIDKKSYIAFNPGNICAPSDFSEFRITTNDLAISNYSHHIDPIVDTAGIKASLKNLRIPQEYIHGPIEVYGSQRVIRHNNNHIDYFSDYRGDVVYGVGFIQQSYVDSLIKQKDPMNANREAVGICTILGYDDKLSSERVRIMLLAVDGEGKLFADSNAYCVEKSWPPK
jgi:hypothetical protein